ncbi:MAG: PDZ domain-containing protein [Planctomycetota bacterium]
MTSLLLAAALLALATRAARAADWSGFIDNQGQVDARVRYYAIGNGVTAYVTDDALVLDLAGAATLQPEPDQAMRRRRCAARLSFARANAAPRLEARTPTPVRRHFFLGNDPARWRTDVREYQEIVYHDVWPGASLVLRASGDELRFGLLLDAGVDAARARLTCEGARLTTLANGSLCVATELRAIVLQRDDSSAPRPDPIETFTEPSLLAWSTFLGGSSDEMAWGTAIDSHGNVLVTGLTLSSHFPSTPGAYDETYNGFGDVFVSKLDADGRQLLWSTLIGGSASNFDYGYALALDASDQPVITGYTWSSDFPTTAGAFDRKHHGQTDAFVSKLGANGDQLLWSTFLGASDQDIGYAVALDAAGNPVVAGRTLSFDFPTTSGAFDRSQNGEEDGFVAKLDASGSTLAWSTFVGGGVFDTCRGVTLASNDDALVVGYTASLDFPITPGAFSTTYNGGLYDVFALRLTAAGSALAWSTYLGGEDYEYGIGIARDAQDDVVITGATASTGFPVTGGAFDTTQRLRRRVRDQARRTEQHGPVEHVRGRQHVRLRDRVRCGDRRGGRGAGRRLDAVAGLSRHRGCLPARARGRRGRVPDRAEPERQPARLEHVPRRAAHRQCLGDRARSPRPSGHCRQHRVATVPDHAQCLRPHLRRRRSGRVRQQVRRAAAATVSGARHAVCCAAASVSPLSLLETRSASGSSPACVLRIATMRKCRARIWVLLPLTTVASSSCLAPSQGEAPAAEPPVASPPAGQAVNTLGDPALLRRELLAALDARIDAIAARAHLEARLALDQVVPIPYLGVDADPGERGVLIKAVYALTAAEAAGLMPGDVLASLDGDRTDSKVTLGAAIRKHRVGDSVELRFFRGGEARQARAVLAPRPEEDEDEDEQFPDLPPREVSSTGSVQLGFENDAEGTTPAAIEAALGGHGLPARFVVVRDGTGQVLRQDAADTTGIRFPIAVVRGFRAGDVVARVRFRYAGGRVDQAAGIVLRYQDPGNYLVARANAAEGDLRIFRVANGLRRTLPGAIGKGATDDDRWHTLEFRARGTQLTATLDDTVTVTAADSYFLTGGAGLWTKSDSITDFDDVSFTVGQ